MENLEKNLLEVQNDVFLYKKQGDLYVFDTTPSVNGFNVDIYKNDGKLTTIPVMFKTKGPASFLPEFDSRYNSSDVFRLSNIAIGFAMKQLKDAGFDKYRLLLASDFDQLTIDKGKFNYLLFDVIGKNYGMKWKQNSVGEEYEKTF